MVNKGKKEELIADEMKQKSEEDLVLANEEKLKREAELLIANEEKAKQTAGIAIADEEKAKRAGELVIALAEKQKRVAELVIAEEEKLKRIAELVIAEEEKAKRVAELVVANDEKAQRVAELVIANEEKAKRLAELIIDNEEKAKRVSELVIANEDKAKQIAELVIINEEKAKQIAGIAIADEEKAKRADELVIADAEKQKRVAELVIADAEKQKRVAELVIAEKEKAKRVAELVIANEEKAKRVAELVVTNNELQQLLQLNSDKDLFISILAHDLRSPFTILLGMSELLIENIGEYETAEIEDHLNLIKKSAEDTFALLEDLLKWIRAQSGKIPFSPQNISLAVTCHDILETPASIARSKDITINNNIAAEIICFTDIDMLKTVLRNLVSNAIKFTNKGGTINITAEETPENVTIAVSDTGIGMKPEKLNLLFDISQVQTTSGTANEKGTGLGLIICKEFVTKHGGIIWVESVFGRGSVFRFTLPVISV